MDEESDAPETVESPRRRKLEKLALLHRDDRLLAVAKPAGLASIPGRGETSSVLWQTADLVGLPASGTDDPRVRVVHRLDKDTSGVLLFATDRASQTHLSHQFQNNTVQKSYLALVAGTPDAESGEIDAPLEVHPQNKLKMHVAKRGRPAKTRWVIEQKFRVYTLLRVFPLTGKTHQIRVHLKHIGLPLAIDPLYNELGPPGVLLSSFKRGYQPKRGEEERPLMSRLTLHAESIAFNHIDKGAMELHCTLPKDFSATLNQLQRHSRH